MKTMAISAYRLLVPLPHLSHKPATIRRFPAIFFTSNLTMPRKRGHLSAMNPSFYYSCGRLSYFIQSIQKKEKYHEET
jgi:hypothetical protein